MRFRLLDTSDVYNVYIYNVYISFAQMYKSNDSVIGISRDSVSVFVILSPTAILENLEYNRRRTREYREERDGRESCNEYRMLEYLPRFPYRFVGGFGLEFVTKLASGFKFTNSR